ncbi:MAG: hypothetical protein M1814_001633 [Vezdaea aestivalis]|nr:MAG: hypothetical protein M1814_001633 [Vezdaea aestivalis]
MADDDHTYFSTPLPTPNDTPYRTPTLSMSRRSSRRGSHSPIASSSPPPPSHNGPTDIANDDSISPLDPRRFTPTLHASLVSEILSLRRDLDSKAQAIEGLESSLHSSKEEYDVVNEALAKNGKETRSLRRQLQLLEGGTSSALGELARERDEAVDGLGEAKKRLENTQKKLRSQEDGADRFQRLWEKDQERWENDRRALERKVHVAEGRMKTVLDEVAAYQASIESTPRKNLDSDTDEARDGALGNESETGPAKSKRPTSSMSMEDPSRFSVLSGFSKPGLSLADELNFDEEDEDQCHEEPGTKDRRESHSDTETFGNRQLPSSYVHQGTQMSPPASPPRGSSRDFANDDVSGGGIGRKRVSILASNYEQHHARARVTVSPPPPSSSIEDPLSPPRTPKSTEVPSLPPVMKTAGTQTEEQQKRGGPPAPIPIPSIAIHRPTSAPSTPAIGLLPALTKDAGCQASLASKSRSIAVQTEEIRVFNRAVKLPPHLLPSAISSNPPTPERPVTPPHQRRKTAKKNLRARQGSAPLDAATIPTTAEDANPSSKIKRPFRSSSLFTGFDRFDLPTSEDEFDEISDSDYRTKLTAPHRQKKSKRFSNPPKAVPEDAESQWGDKSENKSRGQADDFPRALNIIKPGTAVIQKQETVRKLALNSSNGTLRRGRSPSLGENEATGETKQPVPPYPVPTRSSSRKLPPFSYSDGTRSPSNGSASILSGYRQQALPGGRSNAARNGSLRKVRSAAALPRAGRLDARQGSRSPPPMSMSSTIPDSPRLPPIPRDEVKDPRYVRGRTRHQQQASTNTSNTGGASVSSYNNNVSVVDAIAQTMVGEWMFKYVRRRKSFGVSEASQPNWETGKSHEEISANITGNGVRHKRWVWLAPYERAVMWSSRQPTSGSALLGKSGRKLAIQSVLDVKDDTPAPKGSAPGTLFNRSILILTPARALKFTAPNKERHYIWLTALSFLSHSSLGMSDLAQMPSPAGTAPLLPPPNVDMPLSKPPSGALPAPPVTNSTGAVTGLRRNQIRDSIRIAKGKNRPLPAAPSAVGSDVQEIDFTFGPPDESSYLGAAEPPTVPRFSSHTYHGRKRSNTGPKPKTGFRALSNPTALGASYTYSSVPMGISASNSVGTFPSSTSELASPPPHALHSGHSSISMPGVPGMQPRNSEASSAMDGGNFFDAMSTVRMEAFVHQNFAVGRSGDDFVGMSSSRSNVRLGRIGKAGHDGTWTGAAAAARESGGGREEGLAAGFWGEDPFRGF